MRTYTTRISFLVEPINANSVEEVEEKIHQLIDELGAVDTSLSWEDVDWDYVHIGGEN